MYRTTQRGRDTSCAPRPTYPTSSSTPPRTSTATATSQSPPFSQGCPTPINLLLMIFNLRVPHNRYRNLPIRINIPITTPPTNLRSATAREKVDRILGLTIPWNETNPITMPPLPPTSTPYL